MSLNSSDAGTETFDRDVALSMVANEQDALNEIEDAIDRIFDGVFRDLSRNSKTNQKKSFENCSLLQILIGRAGSAQKNEKEGAVEVLLQL